MFALIATLAGCAWTSSWIDTTKQHRSDARARADYKACVKEITNTSPDPNASYDAKEIYQQHLLVCMYAHGWRARSLQQL
jgi:hypothetical protein